MKKSVYKLAATGVFCLSLLPLFGQVTFQKSYGDPAVESEGRDIVEIADGYLVAGYTVSNATGKDGLLIRLDLQGNALWEKTYDLSSVDEFKAVVPANDGGFLAMGIAELPNDIWLLKVSASGVIEWQKLFHRPDSGLDAFRLHKLSDGYVFSGVEVYSTGSSPFAVRIDNKGNILWSKSYQVPNSLMSVGYISDSLWYASGNSNFKAVLMTLDPASGDITFSKNYDAQGSESLDFIAEGQDGNFLLANFAQPAWPSGKINQWVQKVTPSGEVLWSKIYTFPNQENYNGRIISASDGGFLLCPGSGANDVSLDAILLKIDGNGAVDWCHAFGKPNAYEWLLNTIQTSDGGFIGVGRTSNGLQFKNSVYVLKTDAKGRITGCCPKKKTVTISEFPVNMLDQTYNTLDFIQGEPAFGTSSPRAAMPQIISCETVQPAVTIQAALCPGESLSIGGQTYSQPDTVTLELPAVNGDCDTLATYILSDATQGQISQVALQCPQNIVKTVPAGVSSAAVIYATPMGSSDCSCAGLDIIKTAGGDSGSDFPVGTTDVCWQASDACGSTISCCFTVSVDAEPQSVCDIKTTSCLKWELLSITRNAGNERSYRIRLTNTCASTLRYAYFGLPSGMAPSSPANNSVYTAASGREYDVRNPNFSPVYGLRFKSASAGLNGGQSDEFRFTLPQQVSMDYCYVAGRLDNGSFYEAYLNTFFCPVELESAADNRNSTDAAVTDIEAEIAPNPAKPGATLYLRGKSVVSGELWLSNGSGQRVFQGRIADNEAQLPNARFAEGIYFFQVFENGRVIKRGKLVILQ